MTSNFQVASQPTSAPNSTIEKDGNDIVYTYNGSVQSDVFYLVDTNYAGTPEEPNLIKYNVNIPQYKIRRIAGTGTAGFSGDGGPATSAEFKKIYGISYDNNGDLHFTDSQNNVVRKIDSSGTITTVAGQYYESGAFAPSFSGDGGSATNARLYQPYDIAFDNDGNMYIADTDNHRIRKVLYDNLLQTHTTISTFAGDGRATNVDSIGRPKSIVFDENSANAYVFESNKNRIRKIDMTTNAITTFAGTGTVGYADGNVSSAQFKDGEWNMAYGMVFDSTFENLYVADVGNHVIRKINIATSTVTTVAGTAGDSTVLNQPTGLTIDNDNNIYVTEGDGKKVKKIASNGTVETISGDGNDIIIFDGSLASTISFSDDLSTIANQDGFNNLLIATANQIFELYKDDSYNDAEPEPEPEPEPQSSLTLSSCSYASGTITLTFNDSILVDNVGKTITIHKSSDDTVVQSIEVQNTIIREGTKVLIDINQSLFTSGTNYYVSIPSGGFTDQDDNAVVLHSSSTNNNFQI